MKRRVFVKKLFIIALLLIIVTGCAVKVLERPYVNVIFANTDKLPIKVDLQITSELRDAKLVVLTDEGYELPLGQSFAENAELLARHLFSQVNVVGEEVSIIETKADAILIPKMISATQTRPVFLPNDAVLQVVFEWKLIDAQGNLIWVDSITAKGISPLGPGLSVRKGTKRRAGILIPDLFKQSFDAMSSSETIKAFTAEL